MNKYFLNHNFSREHDEDDPKCTNQIESRISNILNPNHMFSLTSTREIELAKKVCRKLILHAWRKRRSQTTNLQLVNNSLKKEVSTIKVVHGLLMLCIYY